MLRIDRLTLSVAVLVTLAATASADVVLDPGLVKWSQLPEMGATGFDYSSEDPLPRTDDLQSRTADDFLCNDPAAVSGVHWWGSYWQAPYTTRFSNFHPDPSFVGGPNPVMPGIVTGFTIRIYDHVAIGVDPVMPYAHPGQELYSAFVPMALVVTNLHGIIDRTGDGAGVGYGDEAVWQYYADLERPFEQTPGTRYWLSIQAAVVPDDQRDAVDAGMQWGWHNADGLVDNNAVQSGPAGLWGTSYQREWVLLPDVDMAFELVDVPEPFTAGLLGAGLAAMVFRRRRRLGH